MILHIGSNFFFKEHSYFHRHVFLRDFIEKVDYSDKHLSLKN